MRLFARSKEGQRDSTFQPRVGGETRTCCGLHIVDAKSNKILNCSESGARAVATVIWIVADCAEKVMRVELIVAGQCLGENPGPGLIRVIYRAADEQ